VISIKLPLAAKLARLVLVIGSMIRSPADRPDFLALSLHHEFSCASRSALVAAYTSLSEAPWVESCSVDVPNLRLALRVSAAATRPSRPTVEWLQRIERLAQGIAPTR
jgi:hypothetical protein